ncbi:unnamed protein product [Nippostrongylus brasiliensis]|uniref:Activin_recp domain-containing protein n=1 Tax=Nippostrongylus brasiliensis TaxID=27835 RepID=A0A0N4XWY0_NIPBR|nr:unnamed protein product [Nippostrongylus brasiliensis]
MTSHRSFEILLLFHAFFAGWSIICYDCHSDQGTCNEGECEGIVCIKMETSNKDNDRRTIQKTCGDELEEVACQQSGFGSKWMSRCVCDTPLCNGDQIQPSKPDSNPKLVRNARQDSALGQALIDAGLEPSSAAPPPGQFTQFALLVAILVFVGASCSLIVIATICVQFC